MRLDQVQTGQGYRVEVPRHLPLKRYPVEQLGLDLWWHLRLLRGSYFELSVTDPRVAVGAEQWVEGWRLIRRGLVEVELTPRQLQTLGLPQGAAVGLRIRGTLCGPAGDRLDWPDLTTVRVPPRWLHPLGADRPRRHHATT